MPIFAYECNSCGHSFEELIRPGSKDKEPEECEECQSEDIRKLMGTPTSIWKPNDGCGGWSMNESGTAYVKTQTGGDKIGGARPDEK